MISIETTTAFISQISAQAKENPHVLQIVSDFARAEPNVVALIATALANSDVFDNPVSSAVFALAIYERLRISQEQADQLKGQMK